MILQVKNTLSYPVSLHALVDGTRRVLSSLEQGKSYDVPVQLMACGCPLQVDVMWVPVLFTNHVLYCITGMVLLMNLETHSIVKFC